MQPAAAGVGALGGADVWTTGGGPAAELRAGLAGARGPWSGGWSSAGELIGGDALLLLDDHRGGVSWVGGGRGGLAAGVRLAGAGYAPWLGGQGWLGAYVLPASAWRAGVELGAGGRWADRDAAPEASAVLSLTRAGTVTWVSRLGVTAWTAPLPPASLRAEQWVGVGERLRVDAGAAATWAPPSDRAAVPGIPAPGSAVLQALAAATLPLRERVELRAELAPELGVGTVPYTRLRAVVGARVRLGRRTAAIPEVSELGTTRFELWAPGADEVAVVGDFTDWAPIPLERQEAGWWVVELPVEPGRWLWGFRVDGTFTTPPVAEAWEPDGFGGVNAVLTISESPATATP